MERHDRQRTVTLS